MRSGRSFTKFLGALFVVSTASMPGLADQPAHTVGLQPANMNSDSARPASLTTVGDIAMIAPRINRNMSSRLRSALEAGFALAVQKLSQQPQCRQLFSDLGADGVEMLSNTLYYQASLKMEKQVCPRALGYTLVGGAPTWVCQQFARLNDRRAAAVLLHEALHHAGIDEWPHDPEGPTPAAIDELVSDACGF